MIRFLELVDGLNANDKPRAFFQSDADGWNALICAFYFNPRAGLFLLNYVITEFDDEKNVVKLLSAVTTRNYKTLPNKAGKDPLTVLRTSNPEAVETIQSLKRMLLQKEELNNVKDQEPLLAMNSIFSKAIKEGNGQPDVVIDAGALPKLPSLSGDV